MAMLLTRSWWLKSRVLLGSRVSVKLVVVCPPHSDQNVREATPDAAHSIVGRSLALFVHLSTTSPPTPALHTPACLTTVFQPLAPPPIMPSSTTSADTVDDTRTVQTV